MIGMLLYISKYRDGSVYRLGNIIFASPHQERFFAIFFLSFFSLLYTVSKQRGYCGIFRSHARSLEAYQKRTIGYGYDEMRISLESMLGKEKKNPKQKY